MNYVVDFFNLFEKMVVDFCEKRYDPSVKFMLNKTIGYKIKSKARQTHPIKIDCFFKFLDFKKEGFNCFFIVDAKFKGKTTSEDVYKQLIYHSIFSITNSVYDSDKKNKFYNLFITPGMTNGSKCLIKLVDNNPQFYSIYPNLKAPKSLEKEKISNKFLEVFGKLYTMEIDTSVFFDWATGRLSTDQEEKFYNLFDESLMKIIK